MVNKDGDLVPLDHPSGGSRSLWCEIEYEASRGIYSMVEAPDEEDANDTPNLPLSELADQYSKLHGEAQESPIMTQPKTPTFWPVDREAEFHKEMRGLLTAMEYPLAQSLTPTDPKANQDFGYK